jgi:hypothetical protein
MTEGALPLRAARTLRVPGPLSPAMAFVAVGVVYGVYVAVAGLGFGADSRAYSAAADQLIATGFDYGTVVGQSRSVYPPAMYVGFATLVALLKLLLGASWTSGLAVLNVLAAAAVGALVARLARRTTDGAAAGWVGLALLLACFNLAVWTRFVLSDATFLLLAFGVFALAADRILRGEGSWVPVFALAVAATFYRPPGVVLIPAAAWALYLARSGPGRGRRMVVAGAAAAAVAGTLLFSWILQQPSRWPLDAFSRPLGRTAHFYALGEVVSARPATYHAPPVSVLDHAAIAADRFLHFFAVSAPEFSLAHVLVNAVFFVPCYALAAWLLVAMARGRDGLSQVQRDVFWAAAGFVLLTAAFHGLLQVDFDWRYRTPILPHLVLLAAGGAAVLLRRRGAAA